jgi:hypothetical protein
MITQPAAGVGAGDDDSIDSVSVQGPEEEIAALRLSEGEEDSCLWQMRCDGARLAARIREVLSTEH